MIASFAAVPATKEFHISLKFNSSDSHVTPLESPPEMIFADDTPKFIRSLPPYERASINSALIYGDITGMFLALL